MSTPKQIDDQLKAAVAKASPVAALLDRLALRDLVLIEQHVPRDTDNEHANKTLECCALARDAATAMRANYWLRQAMVCSKDFMLWDDAIKGEKFKPGEKELKPKTKLYEKFAALHPGNNIAAVDALRLSCPDADDTVTPFFWHERALIERETGNLISVDAMTKQLQKARERMKKRSQTKT